MVQKLHPRVVIVVPNSDPYVKRFQIRVLLSEGSILEPSLNSIIDMKTMELKAKKTLTAKLNSLVTQPSYVNL
jgi:hypothetical protein